ncbi:MAG: type II secretion system F family protein [Acidimicrobiales bacterium]
MTAALLAGLACGLGIWLAVAGLYPAPEPLAAVLARYTAPAPTPRAAGERWDRRLGRVALERVPVLARAAARARADLRVVGRQPEDLVGEMAVYVLFGLGLGPWFGFVTWLVGAPFPAAAAGALSLLVAGLGALVPWLSLRDRAAARRAGFSHALVAYCHVCAMSLAAGRGVDQAMTTAAAAGDGWAFTEIRAALHAGYVRKDTPWDALGRLGADLAIDDVCQLASAIALGGSDGASVRHTILTKATTIRERLAANAEQRTQRATTQMGLPAVALAAGFLVFLGFPAVAVLLDGF